jgi:hypothetical protein
MADAPPKKQLTEAQKAHLQKMRLRKLELAEQRKKIGKKKGAKEPKRSAVQKGDVDEEED